MRYATQRPKKVKLSARVVGGEDHLQELKTGLIGIFLPDTIPCEGVVREVELLQVPEDWPDPLPDAIPGEGVVREVELLQMPKDWADHLPDTIPGEGVVREVELLQLSEDWPNPYLIPYQVKVLSER